MPKNKTRGVARTAVSLAPELLRRMRATKGEVNWSAIAAQAFEAELTRLDIRKGNKKMDHVVERLRASRRECVTSLFETGFMEGRMWAEEVAEEIELRRLERARLTAKSQMNFGYNNWLLGLRDKPNISPRAAFVYCIRPTDYDVLYEEGIDNFWEEVLEVSAPESDESEFVHGFADGALSIWEEVANKL